MAPNPIPSVNLQRAGGDFSPRQMTHEKPAPDTDSHSPVFAALMMTDERSRKRSPSSVNQTGTQFPRLQRVSTSISIGFLRPSTFYSCE